MIDTSMRDKQKAADDATTRQRQATQRSLDFLENQNVNDAATTRQRQAMQKGLDMGKVPVEDRSKYLSFFAPRP
jgi:hypothetical protein